MKIASNRFGKFRDQIVIGWSLQNDYFCENLSDLVEKHTINNGRSFIRDQCCDERP